MEQKVPYDIVMLALPRWDGPYSSTAYSLAKELSRYTRVFYIDNPFTWKDYLTGRRSDQIVRRKSALLGKGNPFIKPIPGNDNLVAVTPKLVLPINWLPPGAGYDMLAKRNEQTVLEIIRALISVWRVNRFVFINSFNPLYVRKLPADLRPLLTIYHCVDDISNSEYISKHGTRLESNAVKNADVTLVTSMELKRLKERDTTKVYYHPNAADVELFQQAFTGIAIRPPELAHLPFDRKIILYMGNICQRLDYELLMKLAEANPDKTVVMVGPQTNERYRTSGLIRLSNVIFTGRKDLSELPTYVAASHCCIIPFLCNALTRSIYPLKVNEYLSGGKPVVTTNFSEDIATFAEVAMVADTHEGFISLVSQAIETDSLEKAKARVAYSARNSWGARARQLLDIIQENLQLKA